MSWSDDVIWWHLHPLTFLGAERTATDTVTHRLPRLAGWLDYVIRLGANGLLLGPVFASASHGYDTLDHRRIDPRLGDDADLDALVAAAHERGVRVVLDGVFNHLAREHQIVRRALAAGPGTPEGAWIRWSGEHPWYFEGHETLVELDLSQPAVQEYVADVMVHWLDRGVDGWRLDAAYAAGPDAWRPVVERVRAAHPGSWLLGEVLHGDHADFVERSGLDTVTQYELWKATWSALNDRNLFELDWTLRRHAEFCATFRPQTFIGNHDVTRIATQLTDPRDLRIAVALLAFLPGVPSIYAGDEQGFTGEKTGGDHGDDAIRPAFPDSPEGLAPFGRDTFELHQRLLAIRRQHRWLGGATLTVASVTNETMTVELSSPEGALTLAINVSDEAVTLPGTHHELGVGPHDWALG